MYFLFCFFYTAVSNKLILYSNAPMLCVVRVLRASSVLGLQICVCECELLYVNTLALLRCCDVDEHKC